jgi:ATP-dependent Clp protease protease subunit
MKNYISDFRDFAIDKVNIKPTVIDSQIKNMITPTVVEERKLNAVVYDVFSRLMLDRIIFLSGEVTPESMDTIVAQMLFLDSVSNEDIHLYINSPGGSVYDGLELVSTMNFLNSDVSTTVLGMAASMGAVISSSGAKGKRNILPYSRVMLHQPSSQFGYSKFTDSKIALKEMESVRNDLYEVLSKNSGKPFDEIVNLCEQGDKWLKGQEVIDLGFADRIIEHKK